jgi:glycosyltransferase involved in cell wall biosynthesis
LGISAIVAAYNEEQTIAEVLTILQRSPHIDEVIVVSDGSTDRTVEIARGFDTKTIALRENQGKGYAMRLGVEHARNNILFFVDGDMVHLTDAHIESLVGPVLSGACDMNNGVRHRGKILDFLHLKAHLGPVLTGIRVMHRAVFNSVPSQYVERFKIEASLNHFCKRTGFRTRNTVIFDLGHVIKETKRGVGTGLLNRWRMMREVALVIIDLYLFQSWRWLSVAERTVGEYDLFEAELID